MIRIELAFMRKLFPSRNLGGCCIAGNYLLRHVRDAIRRRCQNQAERELTRELGLSGGKMTDDLERRIMEKLMHDQSLFR